MPCLFPKMYKVELRGLFRQDGTGRPVGTMTPPPDAGTLWASKLRPTSARVALGSALSKKLLGAEPMESVTQFARICYLVQSSKHASCSSAR